MKWTDKLPVKFGWYWWRPMPDQEAMVLFVDFIGGSLHVIGESGSIPVKNYGGWWQGPIKPKEDE